MSRMQTVAQQVIGPTRLRLRSAIAAGLLVFAGCGGGGDPEAGLGQLEATLELSLSVVPGSSASGTPACWMLTTVATVAATSGALPASATLKRAAFYEGTDPTPVWGAIFDPMETERLDTGALRASNVNGCTWIEAGQILSAVLEVQDRETREVRFLRIAPVPVSLMR